MKRMKILAVVSQKGGVGKTTLATSLAVAAEQAGQNVAVFDLDEQATAAFWGDTRQSKSLVVQDVKASRLSHFLELARSNGCDLVILDCPPVHAAALTAADPADFVLIPTKPDLFDIRAMRSTVALMQSINKPLAVVLTFCPPSGAEVQLARDSVAAINAALAPVEIHQRKAYARAQQEGLAVQEYEPEGKGASEIKSLYAYIHKFLHGGKARGKVTTKLRSSL
jgi:chromosome partitioning protein